MLRLFSGIFILYLILSSAGCAFHITPSVNQGAISNISNKLPAKILLDMSDEFTQFNYVASYDMRKIRYFWGEALKERFPDFMQNIFSSVILLDPQKNQDNFDF